MSHRKDAKTQRATINVEVGGAAQVVGNDWPFTIKIPLGDSPYHNMWLTVIGVVGDARYRELQATRLDFYMSHLQANMPLAYLVVRTASEPVTAAPAIRAIVRELDRNVLVTAMTSMDQIVSRALGNPRFIANVFGVFGLIALVLAALGVYGLLAYSVTYRTQEIGIRMALGAKMSDVFRTAIRNTNMVGEIQ
jgi:putative ABC transport system permease protein